MVLILIEILFFIFLLPFGNVYAYNPITCVAGTSYVEQASNIICNFHKDIKANKTAISVVMVPTTNKKDKEERDVIQCSWAKLATKPECLVSEGYTFNYEVTDRLTVEIPSTTANFAGVYSCHIVPPNGATFETCELIVNEKNTEVSGTSSVQPPQEGVASAENGCSAVHVNLALLIILLLGVILIFLFVGFKLKWFPFSKVARRFSRKTKDDAEQGAFAEETVPLSQTNEPEATATQNANPPSPVSSPSPTSSSSPGPSPGADGKQHEEDTREGKHMEEAGVAQNEETGNKSESPDESKAVTKRSCVVQ